MAIQRWDPRRDLLDLQDRVERLFEEALSRSGGGLDGSTPAGLLPYSPHGECGRPSVCASSCNAISMFVSSFQP